MDAWIGIETLHEQLFQHLIAQTGEFEFEITYRHAWERLEQRLAEGRIISRPIEPERYELTVNTEENVKAFPLDRTGGIPSIFWAKFTNAVECLRRYPENCDNLVFCNNDNTYFQYTEKERNRIWKGRAGAVVALRFTVTDLLPSPRNRSKKDINEHFLRVVWEFNRGLSRAQAIKALLPEMQGQSPASNRKTLERRWDEAGFPNLSS